ncbi:phage DNA packaging protein J [Cupriavidus sp. 2MCAB6]
MKSSSKGARPGWPAPLRGGFAGLKGARVWPSLRRV